MLFKKDIELISDLSIEKTIDKIKLITRQFGTKKNSAHMFEGKINDNQFLIYPIFNFGQREQLRPEIHGLLVQQNNKTKIDLKFRLSSAFKFLFILVIVLNLGITILLMFLSIKTNWLAQICDKWWIIPPIFILTFFIFDKYFDFKVNKSIQILEKTIETKRQD